MKKEELVNIPEIGDVCIRISAKARRISIRMKPFAPPTLIIPKGANIQEAVSFLHEKRQWVLQQRSRLEEKEQNLTIFDEQTQFRTRSFALKIEQHQQPKVRLQLQNGLLHISYPSHLPVRSPEIQKTIRFGIEEALRLEAKRFLPGRLSWLAQQHNISFRNVTIKNLKTRWGSCSATNNINLNLHLMRLPDQLIDYVLLHELCHVHEKNHGPHFWARLDIMCKGKARELDKAMKDYQTKIY
ncbi:M48 family metallopeptidase [Carboxylicivirga mesophila]|uniref:M48 family metallopeptidase n=1 Tax=Carboxylicivirga mesophila TaxID=1166478 RepID=A0ABS5K4V9_9BACT|nr:SprT family zinc-dependent metalloprotease [Carboxylicivirga mesophila]MBS2210040.1 M48 family metallopeptidase [Carboxylicivirga mesophila]